MCRNLTPVEDFVCRKFKPLNTIGVIWCAVSLYPFTPLEKYGVSEAPHNGRDLLRCDHYKGMLCRKLTLLGEICRVLS